MYDDAAAAEGVCRLNHWDKCALPLNALKMALELKQMDTIAFFLKPITGKGKCGHACRNSITIGCLVSTDGRA